MSSQIVNSAMLVAMLAFVGDFLTKWYVVEYSATPSQVIEITAWLNIALTFDVFESFGIPVADDNAAVFSGVLTALAIGAIILLARWLLRASTMGQGIALGAVMGGAAGNIVDRARHGAVADFLDVHIQGIHWPTFNVADCFIFSGVAVLLYRSRRRRSTRANFDRRHTR